jgi:hypothetical protein
MNVRRAISTLLVLTAAVVAVPSVAQAQSGNPCAPGGNPIVCENSKPGTPRDQWEIFRAGDENIQGYATAMSVNKGSAISFKIDTTYSAYKIDVYRLGYYGGDGARLIASDVSHVASQNQPACTQNATTGLIDCGNWTTSATWTVPSTAVSGIYIAKIYRSTDIDAASHITFVVRDDSSNSDIAVQTSDATWQAYNTYGGNSLYQCTVACPPGNPRTYKGAFAVSYNRPMNAADDDGGRSYIWNAEYPMVRFLEANGYNVSYLSQIDTEASPALLRTHKVLLVSGHDEYTSANQRASIKAARDAGVNLAIFSGNTQFWKTRYLPSAAGPSTPNRTLVSYKDTHFDAPTDPVEWTGTWRDRRFTPPGADYEPENSLIGLSFLVNLDSSPITVPASYKSLRIWRNTGSGSSTLAPASLGYEWDADADNGFRPPGQFRLSSTTVSGVEVFTDYGSSVEIGTATHNMVMYRAASGALVFNSGTVQFAYGLDDFIDHDSTVSIPMKQMVVNLLADMGTQPSSLTAGLVAASKSTDTTAPTATITSPSNNATLNDGQTFTVTGTASDAGGVVAGVEVSTDNGQSWHLANGTTSWSYSWVVHGNPSTRVRVRATDDSGNIQTPGAGNLVNVNCGCSLFGNGVTPTTVDSGDPTSAELGMKFTADTYGTITGVRFYKASTNTGTHVGSLWDANGNQLAQATFSNETASGWQTVTFASPVTVQPGQTYVASYFAPNGHYSATPGYFYRSPSPPPHGLAMTDSGPLHAVRNTGGATNGMFRYTGSPSFPVSSFDASNYWVDVVYQTTPAPGAVSNVTAAAAGRTSAQVTWNAPTTGGAPASYKITPFVSGQAQTATTITGNPPLTTATVSGLTTGTTYQFTVQAINPAGSGPASGLSNAVTPQNPVAPSPPTGVTARPATTSAQVSWTVPGSDGDSPITGYTITPYIGSTAQATVDAGASATSAVVSGLTNGTAYTFRVTARNAFGTSVQSAPSSAVTPQHTVFDFATPAVVDSQDSTSVELGMKFTADSSGTVTGVRFYKSAANTGTHTGSLWSATGTRLAQVTFTNESASGWQTATFATPVNITAGTTYVISYFAPGGRYSYTSGGLSNGVANPPLRAVANSTSANGVYAYSATSAFPTSTYNAADYAVDLMFSMPLPGSVSGVTASPGGQTAANVSWNAPTSGGSVTGYRITPYLGSTAQTPTTVTGSPPATTKKVSGLTSGSTYTFTVRALNSSGAGPESAQSNPVTPAVAVAPGAPTNVIARPATKSALVSWAAPDDDGESPITGYTVTPYVDGVAGDPVTAGASATSTTVTGLANGTSYTFRVRAVNAIGTGAASDPSAVVIPRYTVFDLTQPAVADSGDGSAVELGMKFRASDSGRVTGVRFYKSAANTGTHTGSLWNASGTRLAQVTFAGETATGWQTALFSSPVNITAGATYVVSYYAPNGHYAVTSSAFTSAVDKPPLTALATGTSANGVYAYGATSQFPTGSFNASNYWVDVLYAAESAPGTPTGVTATATNGGASVSWTAPSGGGVPTSYEVTPFIGATAQTTKTVTGSPPATSTTVNGLTAGTSYTFKVRAVNGEGPGPLSAASNAVTPTASSAPDAPTGVAAVADTRSGQVSWNAPPNDGGSAITGYRVTPYIGASPQTAVNVGASASSANVTGLTNDTSYTFRVQAINASGTSAESAASNAIVPKSSIFDFATPATVDGNDGNAVQLGVKFRSSVAGTVTGVRFYKAAANTGTHVGSLWSATGQLLGQATFGGESASGWQKVTFATPVAIAADTTYVAGYHAPNGHYSITPAAFSSSGVANPPLSALADNVSSNGVYVYSGVAAYPTNTFNAGNYWVDVLFDAGS